MFTFWNIGIFVAIVVIGALITWGFACASDYGDTNKRKVVLIGTIITGLALVVTMIFIAWYNTNTAAGIRALKDHHSNIQNGIEREIIVTAEDGREIFRYEGKVDIESDHVDNYIKFESEEGERYMIFYGVQDTVTIIEKGDNDGN